MSYVGQDHTHELINHNQSSFHSRLLLAVHCYCIAFGYTTEFSMRQSNIVCASQILYAPVKYCMCQSNVVWGQETTVLEFLCCYRIQTTGQHYTVEDKSQTNVIRCRTSHRPTLHGGGSLSFFHQCFEVFVSLVFPRYRLNIFVSGHWTIVNTTKGEKKRVLLGGSVQKVRVD